MGAAAVQANSGKYERTNDPKRMLTHAVLNEAMRTDWDAVKTFLPVRTATYLRYEKGATTAVAWDEGGGETKIDLPLENGWYVPDGNPFAIPNGRKSLCSNLEARYLTRHQDREYCGSPSRAGYYYNHGSRQVVIAGSGWSLVSGVALVDGRGTAAPLAAIPAERLAEISTPDALLQRAAQLRAAATELTTRLGSALSAADYARLIKPTLDEADFLTELAGKIVAISK